MYIYIYMHKCIYTCSKSGLYVLSFISNSGQTMKRLHRTPHDSGVWQVPLSPCCCNSNTFRHFVQYWPILFTVTWLDHHGFFPFSPGSAPTIAASHGPNRMHLTQTLATLQMLFLNAGPMAEWPVPRTCSSDHSVAVPILPIFTEHVRFGICFATFVVYPCLDCDPGFEWIGFSMDSDTFPRCMMTFRRSHDMTCVEKLGKAALNALCSDQNCTCTSYWQKQP